MPDIADRPVDTVDNEGISKRWKKKGKNVANKRRKKYMWMSNDKIMLNYEKKREVNSGNFLWALRCPPAQ